MTVRWPNIVAAILLLIAFVLFLTNWESIAAFLQTIRAVGPDGTDEERVMGLIAIGFIGILIVAVVRILANGGQQP